jgi:outer membrane lipoprotein-sorting protein
MKKLVLAMSLAMTGAVVSTSAFAAKDCEELKAEIEAKMKANGVKSYSFHIVAASEAVAGQVVGTCDGGQKKIVYQRL